MYYFHFDNTNLLSISVKGQYFDPSITQNLKIVFTPKDIITVYLQDEDANEIPLKKSSLARKNIIQSLEQQQWDKFLIEGSPIDGLANEDGEIVSPLLVFSPHIKIKKNPYEEYNKLLNKHGLAEISDSNVIKKQTVQEHTHIYYRDEYNIFHICFDDFEKSILFSEIFVKQ